MADRLVGLLLSSAVFAICARSSGVAVTVTTEPNRDSPTAAMGITSELKEAFRSARRSNRIIDTTQRVTSHKMGRTTLTGAPGNTSPTSGEDQPSSSAAAATSGEGKQQEMEIEKSQEAEKPPGAPGNTSPTSGEDQPSSSAAAATSGEGKQQEKGEEAQEAEKQSERSIVLLVVQDDEYARFSKEDLPDSLKPKIDYVYNIHVIPGQSHLHRGQGCRNEEVLKELQQLLKKTSS